MTIRLAPHPAPVGGIHAVTVSSPPAARVRHAVVPPALQLEQDEVHAITSRVESKTEARTPGQESSHTFALLPDDAQTHIIQYLDEVAAHRLYHTARFFRAVPAILGKEIAYQILQVAPAKQVSTLSFFTLYGHSLKLPPGEQFATLSRLAEYVPRLAPESRQGALLWILAHAGNVPLDERSAEFTGQMHRYRELLLTLSKNFAHVPGETTPRGKVSKTFFALLDEARKIPSPDNVPLIIEHCKHLGKLPENDASEAFRLLDGIIQTFPSTADQDRAHRELAPYALRSEESDFYSSLDHRLSLIGRLDDELQFSLLHDAIFALGVTKNRDPLPIFEKYRDAALKLSEPYRYPLLMLLLRISRTDSFQPEQQRAVRALLIDSVRQDPDG